MKDEWISKKEINRHARRDVIVHIAILVITLFGSALYFAVMFGAEIDIWCNAILKP